MTQDTYIKQWSQTDKENVDFSLFEQELLKI